MAATRDKSQKFTFIYDNLYALHKSGNVIAIQKKTEELKISNANAFVQLADNLNELERLHNELKKMLDELEKLVNE